LFPQCGQYTTERPSGRVPPQKRQPSGTVAFIIDDSAALGVILDVSGGEGAAAGAGGGDATGKVLLIAGDGGDGGDED